MSDPARTLADVCHEVRSKNAGPFWTTIDLFVKDAAAYDVVADPAFLDEERIGALYRVDPAAIRMFRIPELRVVKISFPRPVSQGSLRDSDMHAGQHHVPLALLELPATV